MYVSFSRFRYSHRHHIVLTEMFAPFYKPHGWNSRFLLSSVIQPVILCVDHKFFLVRKPDFVYLMQGPSSQKYATVLQTGFSISVRQQVRLFTLENSQLKITLSNVALSGLLFSFSWTSLLFTTTTCLENLAKSFFFSYLLLYRHSWTALFVFTSAHPRCIADALLTSLCFQIKLVSSVIKKFKFLQRRSNTNEMSFCL